MIPRHPPHRHISLYNICGYNGFVPFGRRATDQPAQGRGLLSRGAVLAMNSCLVAPDHRFSPAWLAPQSSISPVDPLSPSSNPRQICDLRSGITLVEMLVALAVTLLMMGAVITVFGFIGEHMTDSRDVDRNHRSHAFGGPFIARRPDKHHRRCHSLAKARGRCRVSGNHGGSGGTT